MKKIFENKEKNKSIIFNIVVIVGIFLFSIGIAPKTLQNDTYYTIKVGEYIYQNGIQNLTQDTFSWHELPYTYPHWLYDIGMYVIYNNFGFDGIYFSTIILTALLGYCIYFTSNKASKNKIVSLVLTVLTLYIFKPYIAARAQLITFILFSLTVYFIEQFLNTHKKRYAIPLIIIPILITNLHCAVFPFYFILFLPYIAEWELVLIADLDLDYEVILIILKILRKLPFKPELKEKFTTKINKIPEIIEKKKIARKKRRENPYRVKVEKNTYIKWLILIMVVAGFTGFLNPTGTGAYTYTLKIYQGNTTDSINEHLPVTLIDNKEFLCVLCMILAILVFTDTKIRMSDLFMFLGLTALSLMSRRQISMFLIFCIPILSKLVSYLFAKYDSKTCEKLYNFSSTVIGSIIIMLLFSINTVDDLKRKKDDQYINENDYPVQASTWILENLDLSTLKIYNEYNYGSYLLYRGIPVFIDSRCDLYSPEFNEDKENGIDGRDIFSDALNIAGISVDYKSKFEEYGVTHVISFSNSKLVMLLRNDSSYRCIYEEGNFSIFERLD